MRKMVRCLHFQPFLPISLVVKGERKYQLECDRKRNRRLLTLVFFSCISFIGIQAQDVGQTIQTLKDRWANQPVTISGSLSGHAQFNTMAGILRRRDPLNLNLFGQLNLNILGIETPVSVAIADGNTTYRLPSYTFVGISPSYKWARVHLFRRSMHFSDYTLSGHGFNGAGIELAPGKFRLMVMTGTLRKARAEDYGFRQELDPFYQRRGNAIRLGYEHEGDQFFTTVFKASDDEHSLTISDSLGVIPQENVVVSAEGKKKLSRSLVIEGAYAYSIVSQDKRLPFRRGIGFENILSPLISLNSSSRSGNAYHFVLDFSPVATWAINFKYQRVNPNFISLGTLQFRNDFENFSLGYRGKLAKQITLNGRLGIERNNLDRREIENRERFIGSLQIGIPVNDHWQNSFSYSNFRQTTRLIDNSNPFEPVDSIFLGSVNQHFGFSSSYRISTSQRLLLNFSHQRANSIVNDRISQATSKVHNVILNYHWSPEESRINGGLSLLWNGFRQNMVKTSVISPVLQLNYQASKAINTTLSVTRNFTQINQASNGSILRIGLGGQYRIAKKQRIILNLQYLDRRGAIANNFRELNGRLGYSADF